MKKIFIGSSWQARHYAQALEKVIENIPQVKAITWTKAEAFPLGQLTFQAIEDLSSDIHGAIMIASPDESILSSGKKRYYPRPNVILELGYFVSRLGRENVAFCVFDDVTLPSDIDSFTHLKLGPFRALGKRSLSPNEQWPLEAGLRLRHWVDTLQETQEKVPRVEKFHGYSGRWSVRLTLQRWRGIEIRKPDQVIVEGCANLLIPLNGKRGSGIAEGKVYINLKKAGKCSYQIAVVDELFQVECKPSGKIFMQSKTMCRQICEGHVGKLPTAGVIGGPWHYDWELWPVQGKEHEFEGNYTCLDSSTSKGTLTFKRL